MRQVCLFIAFLLITAISDAQNEARIDSLNEIAVSLARQGKMEQASTLFLECYDESVRTGNDTLISRMSHNLSNVFALIKDFGNAEKYAKICLEKKIALKDTGGVINLYINLAAMYQDQLRLDEALDYDRKALSLSEQLEDTARSRLIYHNIGSIYGRLGKPEKALEYYLLSYEMQSKESVDRLYVRTLCNIGNGYCDLGRPGKALPFLRRSKTISEEQSYMDINKKIYWGLAQAFRLQNVHDSAWHYTELWAAAKDSLYSQSIVSTIEEMEAKFESARKENENNELRLATAEQALEIAQSKQKMWYVLGGGIILILLVVVLAVRQKAVSQRKQTEFTKKQADLEQRALRARMNPHFLFNALSTMQHMYVNGKTREANEFMADFSQLLRNILDNTGRKFISLRDELDTLSMYVELEKQRFDDNLNYQVIVDEEVDMDSVLLPPMIIQPFVENAIWHGIAPNQSGNVKVKVYMDGMDILEVEVQDDGVGLNNGNGNGGPSHKSQGISLTEERLGEKGGVDIQPLDTGGTQVLIRIPITYGT